MFKSIISFWSWILSTHPKKGQECWGASYTNKTGEKRKAGISLLHQLSQKFWLLLSMTTVSPSPEASQFPSLAVVAAGQKSITSYVCSDPAERAGSRSSQAGGQEEGEKGWLQGGSCLPPGSRNNDELQLWKTQNIAGNIKMLWWIVSNKTINMLSLAPF